MIVKIAVSWRNGASDIIGWSIISGNVDYIGTTWTASDGNRSIDLNGLVAGTISQSINTVDGSAYQVLFDMATNPGYTGLDRIVRLGVSAAGETTAYSFDISGKTGVDMGWEQKSFVFTATGTTSTLTFKSTIAGAGGPALDNVR